MEGIAARVTDLFKQKHSNVPFEWLKMRWDVFPDGTENSEFFDIEKTEGRHVLFLASFSSPTEKLRQLSAIYVLTRRFAKSLTVLLPFSPSATMERIDGKSEGCITRYLPTYSSGVIATADVDAHFFSSMPQVGSGPIKVIIYDLHTLHNRFYFHNTSLAKMTTAVPLIKVGRFLHNFSLLKAAMATAGDDINIAFPDEGACKRFAKFFPEFTDPVVCGKVRLEDDKRVIKITDGVAKGKHCVCLS
jgi:hypothetical protein